jgi:hypothetical protein
MEVGESTQPNAFQKHHEAQHVQQASEPAINWPIFNSLWKERELQRFVDQNLFDLSESCVKADDTLLNRICRSPLRSGKTQATLGDMF